MAAPSSPAEVTRQHYLAAAFASALLSLGVVVLVWHARIVPEKMTYDSQVIQDIATGRLRVSSDDKSYGNIGALYRWLGLSYQPMVASVLGYGIYFLELTVVIMSMASSRLRLFDRAILAAAALLGALFLGQYSKDVLIAILCLLAFKLGRTWWSEVFFVSLTMVYAFYFRQYWFLVMAFYVMLRLVQRRSRALWVAILFCLAALVVLSFAFPLVAHIDVQSFRMDVNVNRIGSEDAQSMIVPAIAGSSPAIGAMNSLITFFELLIPIPMLMSSPNHAVYGLFLLAIWVRFLGGFRRGLHDDTLPPNWARCAALALAMVSVQAIFEPDYGSYLRHLTPMLPLMVYVAVLPKARSSNLGEFIK